VPIYRKEKHAPRKLSKETIDAIKQYAERIFNSRNPLDLIATQNKNTDGNKQRNQNKNVDA